MTVRFIKSPSGSPYFLAYFIGDNADLEPALAKDLIDQKMAVAVEPTPKPSERTERAISPAAKIAEKR